MSTAPPQNDPNNIRLRELIESAGLSQANALAIFNRGLPKPYSLSIWKAYLSDPSSMRWRKLDPKLLAHAEKTIGKAVKKA